MNLRSRILLLLLCVTSPAIFATPLTGSLHIYQPGGTDIIPPTPITGDIDLTSNFMSVEPFFFLNIPVLTNYVELLGEGTHTRSSPQTGVQATSTVQPGQIGAYLHISWANNDLSTFMVWNINQVGNTITFTPADSDGDGTPGHMYISGPFTGLSAIYEFTIEGQGPGIALSLSVLDGLSQECNQTGGNQVDASVTVTLLSGAELTSLEWTLDGSVVGTNEFISKFMSLGTHTLSVTAYGTNDLSVTTSATINIVDRIAPVLFVGFVDKSTNTVVTQINNQNVNRVIAKYEATDVCDPAPAIDGIGGFKIQSGEVIKIKNEQDKIVIPTSDLTLQASARDASGNTSIKHATLTVSE